jgi:hypothetical protein
MKSSIDTMNNSLVFTKAATARILKVKATDIVSQHIRAKSVWVSIRGMGAIAVSKAVYLDDFTAFRKASGQGLKNFVINLEEETYCVPSEKGGGYLVEMPYVSCTCEDYIKQVGALGGGVCKHGYAVLAVLGYGSLADYRAAHEMAA